MDVEFLEDAYGERERRDSRGVVFEGVNDDSVDDYPGLRGRSRSLRIPGLSLAFPFHKNLLDIPNFR